MSDPALLARTAERLRRVPGFIAFELERYHELTQVDAADDFGFPQGSVVTLGLCRRPRRDHYAADVAAIAERVGATTSAVANFLRAADAVSALASRTQLSQGGEMNDGSLMAAARDHGEERTAFEEPAGRELTLPGWLMNAVDRFWGDADEGTTLPRDLHLPILTELPLAIIEIEGLTVQNLDQWLHTRHLPQLAQVANRPLRGCLVAYAGVGLLFVDRSDDPEQRRLTLAHEAAHFVVDYLIPRENVARRRPQLLDVLDGEREPTDAERFDALLADVHLGFHTHLLERDPHGGNLAMATADVEDRAERLALELLAPLQRVLREAVTVGAPDIERVLQERFGLPAGVATRYANHVRRYRPVPPRTLLEAIGLAPADQDEANHDSTNRPETES